MDKTTHSARTPGGARRQRSEHLWPLVAINGVALALAAHFLNNHLNDWGGDNVQFILLAQALVKGQGYVNLHLPGAPLHAHYPPVYPLLLAPLVALGGVMTWMKAFTAALGVAGLNAAYFFFAPIHGRVVATLVALVTLCSEAFLDSGFSVMSDGPFVLFAFLTLLLVRRAFERDAKWGRATAAAGALAGIAILTRTVGAVLLPGVLPYALLYAAPRRALRERITRYVVFAAVTCAVASPWAGIVATKGLSRYSYLQELKSGTAASNAQAEKKAAAAPAAAAGEAGDEGSPAWRMGMTILLACGVALGLAGAARGGWVRRGVEVPYAAVYAVVLYFWTPGGARLWMPLLPIFLVWLYEGVTLLAVPLQRAGAAALAARMPLAGVTVLAAIGLSSAATLFLSPITHERLRGHDAAWWDDYLRVSCIVATHVHDGDLVLAHPDDVPYYLADVQAAKVRPAQRKQMFAAIMESGARFVILTPFQHYLFGNSIENAVRENPDRFKMLADAGVVQAYLVVRDDGGPQTVDAIKRRPRHQFPQCQGILRDVTER